MNSPYSYREAVRGKTLQRRAAPRSFEQSLPFGLPPALALPLRPPGALLRLSPPAARPTSRAPCTPAREAAGPPAIAEPRHCMSAA